MITAIPALTVSTIYLAWDVCRREQERRDRVLRERVAYMLWVAANGGDSGDDDDDEPPDDDPEPRGIPRPHSDRS
ncbi:MAG TPA: hypothetical protein VKA46_00985 [Gemmataceae bacterium]|nr:hypothetical protein [Gemmataceae bacterium]